MNPPSTSETGRLQKAISLHQSKQYDRAASVCEGILATSPNNHDAVHMLGLVRSSQRDLNSAISLIKKAILLAPDVAAYHHNLGGLNRQMGRMKRATHCFLRAIRLKSDYGEAYQALSELGAFSTTPPPETSIESSNTTTSFAEQWLLRIERELDVSTIAKNQSYLHFAAAKLCEQQKDYNRAFEHYRQGNQKSDVICDLESYRTLVTDNLYIFNANFQTTRADFGIDSDRPIFVVGMPRSGTTLVEHILATHPDVFGAGELPDIYSITQTLPSRFNPSPRYPLCMALAPKEAIAGYANGYLARLNQIAGETAGRVVDKHPLNFLYLGFIFTAFPNAKVIHLQRDARDTCLSCYQQNFSNGVTFSFDLNNLGTFYRFYQRQMEHWSQYRPNQILHLQYQQLTADPDTEIRRLLDFCDLPWDANCLNFHTTDRTVQTASANQVRQPLYRSSVGRWKHYESHLGSLFNSLQWGDILFSAPERSTNS